MNKILDLNLDYSLISEKERDKWNKKINSLHQVIRNRTGDGNEFMDWLTWPSDYDKKEVDSIIKKVEWLKKQKVEKLLVIGIGGSYLGAQAAIDFIKGKIDMQDKVIFAGINTSSLYIKQLEKLLKDSKWAICVISKSGTTLEPALSFRHFKNLLEAKMGPKAKDYIIAVTDKEKGALRKLADKNEYTTYSIPDGIGGRFSGITPVGLFPMAFAGIDIVKVLDGTFKAMNDLKEEKNIAYDYALTRYLLNTKYKKVSEIFTVYEPDLIMTNEWLKQLFGESEGKEGKGIMPMSVNNSADLHSLGQIIQEGNQNFFETIIWVEKDMAPLKIKKDKDNLDGLNYLADKTFYEINKKEFEAVLKAHYDNSKTPNIIFTIKDISEESLGYLWYFFFITVTMSGYLLGINPFNQPGVELYKKNMFDSLKK